MDRHKCSMTFLTKYINQLSTDLQAFTVPPLYEEKDVIKVEEEEVEDDVEEEEIKEEVEKSPPCPDFFPFQPSQIVDKPAVCLWLFMEKDELEKYLNLGSKRRMRTALEQKIGNSVKGFSRIIMTEFMIDATIFSVNSKFSLQQTSAIMGIYYLAHKYFTDHLYVCPEDVLIFFKEFLMHHSLLFPPTHIKLFNIEECKGILLHFCRLYLRHMPLIRLLSLPNFGFELGYELEPEAHHDKKGKGKDKKGGKKDKKKKDKKSDKKSKSSGKKSKK